MDVEQFDVCGSQAVPAKEFVQRRQRKIAKMFMINGVELTVIDHFLYIRNFDDRDAIIFE